ncbi:MAG TPA: ion transporter, partial [Gemmatimonadales bacterium]|nr:ion transporter [Gemmatimonadales bacterium]
GDIAPETPVGQALASVIMLLGYAIVAIPTGIVTVEIARRSGRGRACSGCGAADHQSDAGFCRLCGLRLS